MDTDLYNLMINSSGFLILPVFFSLGTGAQLDSQSIINLLGRELGVYGNRQKKKLVVVVVNHCFTSFYLTKNVKNKSVAFDTR